MKPPFSVPHVCISFFCFLFNFGIGSVHQRCLDIAAGIETYLAGESLADFLNAVGIRLQHIQRIDAAFAQRRDQLVDLAAGVHPYIPADLVTGVEDLFVTGCKKFIKQLFVDESGIFGSSVIGRGNAVDPAGKPAADIAYNADVEIHDPVCQKRHLFRFEKQIHQGGFKTVQTMHALEQQSENAGQDVLNFMPGKACFHALIQLFVIRIRPAVRVQLIQIHQRMSGHKAHILCITAGPGAAPFVQRVMLFMVAGADLILAYDGKIGVAAPGKFNGQPVRRLKIQCAFDPFIGSHGVKSSFLHSRLVYLALYYCICGGMSIY